MTRAWPWVDGRLMAVDEPALPVADRAFQLGDGLFETLRVRRGVAIELALHLDRLREGLRVLAIPPAMERRRDRGRDCAVVASANAPADAAVRITVSRGAPNGRGLLPRRLARPAANGRRAGVAARPVVAAEVLDRGVRAVIAPGAATRLSRSPR